MKLDIDKTHVKIPISLIKDTTNVRLDYDIEELEQLAKSIFQNGLLNPLTVKPAQEDSDGNKTYELIAGHRRLRALKLLCEQGHDFSIVECCVRTGDMWTLQMIENIQRTALSSRDKEEAVVNMIVSGLTQKQIAERLCKPISYVSDIIAGYNVRREAEERGIQTGDISTKALSQLRSIPNQELSSAIADLQNQGGTIRAATQILHKYKDSEQTESAPGTQKEETTFVSSEKSDEKGGDGCTLEILFETQSQALAALEKLKGESGFVAGQIKD